MKRSYLIIVLVGLCVVGAFIKPESASRESAPVATATSEATKLPTYTNTIAACDMHYYDVVVDTVTKLSESTSIDAVDALITRYDSTEVPYGCGRNDALLDMTDYSVRIALGEKRTTFMSKDPKSHEIASQVSAREALQTIQEWRNE